LGNLAKRLLPTDFAFATSAIMGDQLVFLECAAVVSQSLDEPR